MTAYQTCLDLDKNALRPHINLALICMRDNKYIEAGQYLLQGLLDCGCHQLERQHQTPILSDTEIIEYGRGEETVWSMVNMVVDEMEANNEINSDTASDWRMLTQERDLKNLLHIFGHLRK